MVFMEEIISEVVKTYNVHFRVHFYGITLILRDEWCDLWIVDCVQQD